MVSRRNFVSICIMMAVILALFQFSLLMRDIGGGHDVNGHLTEITLTQADAWTPGRTGAPTESVVYIGSQGKATAEIVRQWGD